MIDFTNFHIKTIAIFKTDTCPEREPDFVSDSWSAYWDVGHGVIRSSDHWAGWGDCTGQASCIWGYQSDCTPQNIWKTGYCAYSAFTQRKKIPILHRVSKDDRILAKAIMDAGGILDPSEYSGALPLWARECAANSNLLPARLRCTEPGTDKSTAVLYAPDQVLRDITAGAPEIEIGKRLDVPFWALA